MQRSIMAKRLKFRESISEAEHYFCKHCTTMYIGGHIDKYRKRKHNEKIIMNSTHITYELIYNMCYLIIFFFALRLKKYFLFISAGEIRKQYAAGTYKFSGKRFRSEMTVQELQE